MNLKQQRAAVLKAAQEIVAKAKAEARDLTAEEITEVEAKSAEVTDLDAQIARATKSAALVTAIGGMAPEEKSPTDEMRATARTLGDHFMLHAKSRLASLRDEGSTTIAAPEYKAATDPQITTGSGFVPVLTQYDRTVVQGVRTRLVVADLLGSGTISGNAISYFVEGALEGAFATVAEAGAKPQLHVVDPTAVTDSLKKIAGFIKFTDEMVEDLDFYVSEINGRLLYELARIEEQQLLNGAGTGSTVQGILLRSGIQTETGATIADNADAVFRAMTKVGTGSSLDADGVVIHPTDYQTFRLKKDGNNQYYGGGFFAAEYGNGTLTAQPPLWGLRTVVTPAITAGTVLVGAFAQAATVYRKGGVRVESTNSHASDFTSNLITTRAEERIALALRHPAGLVKLTLGTT